MEQARHRIIEAVTIMLEFGASRRPKLSSAWRSSPAKPSQPLTASLMRRSSLTAVFVESAEGGFIGYIEPLHGAWWRSLKRRKPSD